MQHGNGLSFQTAQDDETYLEQPSEVRPERNLVAALLARAICDAFGTAHVEMHIRREARHWIFSNLEPKKPFSFAWAAHALDLDPEIFRTALKEQTVEPNELATRLQILR